MNCPTCGVPLVNDVEPVVRHLDEHLTVFPDENGDLAWIVRCPLCGSDDFWSYSDRRTAAEGFAYHLHSVHRYFD